MSTKPAPSTSPAANNTPAPGTSPATRHWHLRLDSFLDSWIATQPALAAIAPDLDIALHGSTTAGIDDAWSDLDLWGFVPAESLAAADRLSPTRFYEFTLDGKPGHLNLESRDEARGRVDHCDMERIAELRCCAILRDRSGSPAEMQQRALRPMPDDVRRAFAMYHYVEMRSEHRACDTPIERGDHTALLLALSPLIAHALRCALIIDAQPYPYIKWLGKAAAQTPTGACVCAKVQDLLQLLAQDALRHGGPEKTHPLSLKIREIRALLIDRARTNGLDGQWLTHWWLWLTQSREAIAGVRWS